MSWDDRLRARLSMGPSSEFACVPTTILQPASRSGRMKLGDLREIFKAAEDIYREAGKALL